MPRFYDSPTNFNIIIRSGVHFFGDTSPVVSIKTFLPFDVVTIRSAQAADKRV